MNTEQTSENIFTHMKKYYDEPMLAKIWKLKKVIIKYLSYTNHLTFSLCCHHKNVLPKDLKLKSTFKTERSKTTNFVDFPTIFCPRLYYWEPEVQHHQGQW